MRVASGLVLLLFVTALSSGQTKREPTPHRDLSGTWKLNREKSALRVFAETAPEMVVIAQSEKQIEFKRQIRGRLSSVTYLLDGNEQVVSTFDHHERLARAHWSKGSLIIEERTVARFHDMPDVEDAEKVTMRWILSADGKALTERNSEQSTTSVFELQE